MRKVDESNLGYRCGQHSSYFVLCWWSRSNKRYSNATASLNASKDVDLQINIGKKKKAKCTRIKIRQITTGCCSNNSYKKVLTSDISVSSQIKHRLIA